MSKTLRKILTSTSAILMLMGVGASATGSTVSAKRYRPRTHRAFRHHRRHYRRRDHARKHKRRHHESLAKWYLHNGKRVARDGVNRSPRVFHDTFDNSQPIMGMSDGILYGQWALSHNPKTRSNTRHAWIVGHAYGKNDNSFDGLKASNYARAIEDYNNGIAYLKNGGATASGTVAGKPTNGFIYIYHGEWGQYSNAFDRGHE